MATVAFLFLNGSRRLGLAGVAGSLIVAALLLGSLIARPESNQRQRSMSA